MNALDILESTVKSLHLDHCWVCEEKFTEYGGKPDFFKHDHHIIPRAYGGVDGPTVSLCDSHHGALHKLALLMEKKKNYQPVLTGKPKADKRLMWLASCVCNAKALVKDDPNKTSVIIFTAKRDTKEELKKLRQIYKSSMASIIEYAIHSLYSKHFFSKKKSD